MRCYCCNKILSNQEATRKFKTSGEFVDMCNKCLTTVDEDVQYTDGYCEEDDKYETDS